MSEPFEIDWDGDDGRKLSELRNAFLARSESGQPGPTVDYWECERDLELYDATLGTRIGWRWDWVLGEATASGARCAQAPARTVVDLGCGTGVAARAAFEAGWIADDATVTCVDRSPLAREFAAARLRELGPSLRVQAAALAPGAPDLLLIGHLLLELSDASFLEVIESVRAATTTVWVEPGTHTAGRRLSDAHDALHPERLAIAPCPHAGRCGLLAEGHARDWCHHFPEPPAEAFTESLPGRVAQELGIDLRSLATSYLVLEPEPPARAPDLGRVLGRPKIEKGRARIDLCRQSGVERLDLSKRDDAGLWRAWKRPGREHLLYRVDVDGHRLKRATPFEGPSFEGRPLDGPPVDGPSSPAPAAPVLRPIRPDDDPAIARIIRTVMPEFGATGDGFAITDPEVDGMCAAYAGARAVYFVVEDGGRVLGGCGIAPLEGGDGHTCELRKMYFLPEVRGRGIGRRLLEQCLDAARERQFSHCYIETLNGMDAAMALYESLGFEPIAAPLGQTGHHGCDRYYLLAL